VGDAGAAVGDLVGDPLGILGEDAFGKEGFQTIRLNAIGSEEIELPPMEGPVGKSDLGSIKTPFFLSIAMNSRQGKVEMLWNSKPFTGAANDVNIMLSAEQEDDLEAVDQEVRLPQDSRYVTLKGWLAKSDNFGLEMQVLERFDLPDDVPVKGHVPKGVNGAKMEGSFAVSVVSISGRSKLFGFETDDVILKCKNSLTGFGMMRETLEWADIACISDMETFLDTNTFAEMLVFRKGVLDLDQRVVYNNHRYQGTNAKSRKIDVDDSSDDDDAPAEKDDDDDDDDAVNRFNDLSGCIVHDYGPNVLHRYTIMFDDLKSTVDARPSEIALFDMGEYVDVYTVLTINVPSLAVKSKPPAQKETIATDTEAPLADGTDEVNGQHGEEEKAAVRGCHLCSFAFF
jgi:hypothetical protein